MTFSWQHFLFLISDKKLAQPKQRPVLKIAWYFICLLILLIDQPKNGNFGCNQPYAGKGPFTIDTIKTAIKPSPYVKVSFYKAVLKGADEVEVANSYQAILKDNVLKGIFMHSPDYLEDVRQFLSSQDYTTDQKVVALCLIQSLPLDEYLSLSSYVATLYKQNKIEEEVLMWILAPNFSNNQILARNFQNPKVITVLKDIRQIDGLSRTTKRVINQILSGDETKFL